MANDTIVSNITYVIERLDDKAHVEERVILRQVMSDVTALLAEVEDASQVPPWIPFVQDLIYYVALTMLYSAWIIRSAVQPQTLIIKCLTYAVDSAERLAEAFDGSLVFTVRQSKTYPFTTRLASIRKSIRKKEHEHTEQ